MIKPVDAERLRNWPDVFDGLRDLEGLTSDGKRWMVPASWGSSSVIYRHDLVEFDEPSWGLLFDERYKGRLAVWDSAYHAVAAAALALGYDNPFSLDEAQLANVDEMLTKQRDLLRFYWTDMLLAEQAMASGEIVATDVDNGSVTRLRNQGMPVTYMNPKEGRMTWVCGFVMIADGPGDEQEKYDYIDAWLDPISGKNFMEETGYGHGNRKAFDLMEAARLEELGLDSPEQGLAQGVLQVEVEAPLMERYIEIYEEAKAGY